LRAFRWIPARDTAQVVVPGARIDERFDCTVTRLQVISSGAGVRDTTVFMSTYTQVIHGEQINLRNLEFRQSIDLKLTLTGIQSLDSIIVPDGLTFIKPQRSNNFSGQFRVLHTGNLWIRVRINGEDNWRFLWFEKVEGPELVVSVDPKLWTILFAKPFRVNLPFTAPWQYKVEGILDTAKRQFVPMGDLLRAGRRYSGVQPVGGVRTERQRRVPTLSKALPVVPALDKRCRHAAGLRPLGGQNLRPQTARVPARTGFRH
jgi:hypothetical protein